MTVEKLELSNLLNRNNWTDAIIVFTARSFIGSHEEKSRSFAVKKDAKFFDPSVKDGALSGNSLDGTRDNIRLDLYMKMVTGWRVEYCYIIK